MSDQPTTDEPTTTVSTATRARAFGILKAQYDELGRWLKQAEAEVRDDLIDHFLETGFKTTNLTLPNGTKFGAITVREPSDVPEVRDPAAWLAWVYDQDALSHNVETVERVNPTFEKTFLTDLVGWVDDPTWEADPDGPEDQQAPLVAMYQGEIVPGLGARRAPKRPTAIATTFVTATKAKGKVKTEANQLDGRQRALGFLAEQGTSIESLLGQAGALEAAPSPQVPATA